MVGQSPIASIIIPAHNEEFSIGRLLDQLLTDVAPGELEVLILCNGCTDRTADVARRFEPRVTVVDLPQPSKQAALKHGDTLATVFPRLYIDSDVEIRAADVRAAGRQAASALEFLAVAVAVARIETPHSSGSSQAGRAMALRYLRSPAIWAAGLAGKTASGAKA